jgi:hypothetical protein
VRSWDLPGAKYFCNVWFFEILDFVRAVAGSEFVNFCKYK